ncbi:Glutamate receptor ionotropic, NMDA 2B-like 1, partial [Homarus americanus]
EAHFCVGPLTVTTSRTEVVDFTSSLELRYLNILAGRGRTELDPWGFLLPFSQLVWAAILTALLVLLVATSFLPSCLTYVTAWSRNRVEEPFVYIRLLLNQDSPLASEWWWERLLLAVWMLTTLVLKQSYSGNLISHLAVRYIPEPYQTLREVVDDSSASVIWPRDSSIEQYIR